jgi:outer membrane receptor for ferrienterochelin and colicin
MQKRMVILLVLITLSLSLFAGTTGKLMGKVKDDKEKPVPYASVIISGEGFQTGIQTDKNGNYFIINIPPGTYTVSCQRGGFATSQTNGVKINVDETKKLNIKMISASIAIQGIVVSEEKEEMVKRDVASSQTSINSEQIQVMATDDVSDILALQTGVNVIGGEVFVRGGRSNEVQYSVDGMSVSDPVDGGSALTLDTDAIADMKTITGGLTAEYGNAQSGVVNIVTKSGSSDYHGKLEASSDHLLGDDIDNSNSDVVKFAIGGPVLTSFVSENLRKKFTFFFNAAANWYDGRVKDYYVSDPVEELKYLTQPSFTSFDPYDGREDFAGFDLGDRNYNDYNANLKVKYDFNPLQKLTFAVRGDKSKYRPYAHAWKYAMDYYFAGESSQAQYIATYDHSFNSMTNLKVKASYYHKETESGPNGVDRDSYFVRDDANFNIFADNAIYNCTGINYLTDDSGVIGENALYNWTINSDAQEKPIGDFVRPGTIFGNYVDDENQVLNMRADLEFQLNQIHGFKTGVEVIKHTIRKNQIASPWDIDAFRYEDYLNNYGNPQYWVYSVNDSIIYSETELPEYSEDFIKNLYDLDDLYNATLAASGQTDGYEAEPWQFAYYLQDKMEWEGMIVNAGLRFDAWYLGEKYKIIKNNGIEVWEEFDKEDQMQLMVSPRMGISHPISETAVMHFAYNYQNQLPQMQYVFTTARPEDAITSNTQIIVGNPDLEPQTTITYEVGLQKQLSEDYVMDITAYYKNIYNYVSTRKVTDPDDETISWYEYFSDDYGSARGLDIGFNKRLANFITGQVSYSLSWANGNNSDTVVQDEATNLREFPLDWDMRHNFSTSVTWKVQKGEEFYVPYTDFRLPFDDFSVNMTYSVQSGRPYTPTTQEGNALDTNSALKPHTEEANMKITKTFAFNENSSVKVYCSIDNLFDKTNVNNVYSITGSPYYDGADISEPNSDYVAEEVKYIHDLATKNPFNVSQGRSITFGVNFNF